MSHSVADLLAKNPNLQLTENNKIKCSLTNHEMPPNAEAIVQYLNGKKFKKAKEWYNCDFSEFLPHIVPDRKNPMKLFCKLTKLSLNKIPEEVRKHVGGKKFQRLKAEFEAKKQKKTQKTEKADDDSSEDMWVSKLYPGSCLTYLSAANIPQ
jgi:Surfeit locus protein 2 (SURF2)